MKYKHLQIIIGVLAIVILAINIYYKGHILTSISMILLSIGMGVQAYSLNKKEKKNHNPIYIKKERINPNFLLLTIFLGSSGFFAVKKWWILFVISILLSTFFAVNWFKKMKNEK